jgi:hypothetical protein
LLAQLGEPVLVAALDAARPGGELGVVPHMAVFEGAPQAVEQHRVFEARFPDFQSLARPAQQVRRLRHVLHAAGNDNPCVAETHGLRRQHDGFQSRSTHLVDRQRRDGGGEARLEGRLTGWGLPRPGRKNHPHDDFIYVTQMQSGAKERRANGDRSQLRRRNAFQRPQKPANGGPRPGE